MAKTKKNNTNNELPNDVTTEEFLLVLDNITKRLANKFRFAYHTIDDMKQQAAIFALEGLKNYDKKRPLENFLWTHVRNRLFNYKRNNYQRPDKPCFSCPFFDQHCKLSINQCEQYTNKQDCELYSAWAKRNEAKKNIIQPGYLESNTHFCPSSKDNLLENKELIDLLDQYIHSDYREIYLKLKHGYKINKVDMKKLKNHILKLAEEHNWTAAFQKNEDN
jgi:hypothetical protein